MKFVISRVTDPDGLYKPLSICKRELVEYPLTGLEKAWVVNISSLEELVDLIQQEKKNGKYFDGFIVNVSSNGLTTITIYDDYME